MQPELGPTLLKGSRTTCTTCSPQVHAVQYAYSPGKFEAVTEKSEAYKAWPIEQRPQPQAPPLRPTLPFEGAPCAPQGLQGGFRVHPGLRQGLQALLTVCHHLFTVAPPASMTACRCPHIYLARMLPDTALRAVPLACSHSSGRHAAHALLALCVQGMQERCTTHAGPHSRCAWACRAGAQHEAPAAAQARRRTARSSGGGSCRRTALRWALPPSATPSCPSSPAPPKRPAPSSRRATPILVLLHAAVAAQPAPMHSSRLRAAWRALRGDAPGRRPWLGTADCMAQPHAQSRCTCLRGMPAWGARA